jgi:hypothetical protein
MTAIAATVSRRGSRWGGTRTAPLITSLVVRVLSDADGLETDG